MIADSVRDFHLRGSVYWFLSWHLCGLENIRDHGIRGDAIKLSLGAQRQTMTKHGQRNVAHVVGRDEIASTNRGECFRAKQQRYGRSRTRAVMDERVGPGASDKVNSVMLNTGFHLRARDLMPALHDRGRIVQRLYVYLVQAL